MKNLYLLFIAFVTLTITNAQTYQVTFEVNTEAIVGLGGEVGPNGMYLVVVFLEMPRLIKCQMQTEMELGV